jgi:hypothetical protein
MKRQPAAMILATLMLLAQTAVAAPPPRIDCTDAEHRALDFWIGDWVVIDTASGAEVARSRIGRGPGGCSLSEDYRQTVSSAGKTIDYHGQSFTAFNTADRRWRQLYVDTSGAAFSYDGGFEGPALVLMARAGPLGTRMSVAPQADGSVRQRGWKSSDSGQNWQPNYDFTYRRREPGARGAR